jgi:hypothetical protein
MDVVEPEGDAACWLQLVCTDCGALIEGRDGVCWRCGGAAAVATGHN